MGSVGWEDVFHEKANGAPLVHTKYPIERGVGPFNFLIGATHRHQVRGVFNNTGHSRQISRQNPGLMAGAIAPAKHQPDKVGQQQAQSAPYRGDQLGGGPIHASVKRSATLCPQQERIATNEDRTRFLKVRTGFKIGGCHVLVDTHRFDPRRVNRLGAGCPECVVKLEIDLTQCLVSRLGQQIVGDQRGEKNTREGHSPFCAGRGCFSTGIHRHKIEKSDTLLSILHQRD